MPPLSFIIEKCLHFPTITTLITANDKPTEIGQNHKGSHKHARENFKKR